MIRIPLIMAVALSLLPLSTVAQAQVQATQDQTNSSKGPEVVDRVTLVKKPVVVEIKEKAYLKKIYQPKVFLTVEDEKTKETISVQKELNKPESYIGVSEPKSNLRDNYAQANQPKVFVTMEDKQTKEPVTLQKELTQPKSYIGWTIKNIKDFFYGQPNPAKIENRAAKNEETVATINDADKKVRQARLDQIEAEKTAPSAVDEYFSDLFNLPMGKNITERYGIGFSGNSFYRHDPQTGKTVFRDLRLNNKITAGVIVGYTKGYIYFKTPDTLIQVNAQDTSIQNILPIKITGFTTFGNKPVAVVQGVGVVTFENEENLSLTNIVKLGTNNFLENGVQSYDQEVGNSAGKVTHTEKGLLAMTDSRVYRIDLQTGKTYAYSYDAFFTSLLPTPDLTVSNVSKTFDIPDWEARGTLYKNGVVQYQFDNRQITVGQQVGDKIDRFIGLKDDTTVFYQKKTYALGKPELRVVNMISGNQPGKSRLIPNESGITGFTRAGTLIYLFKVGEVVVYDLSKENIYGNPLKIKNISATLNGAPLEIASGEIVGKELIMFNKNGNKLERLTLSGDILAKKTIIKNCEVDFASLNTPFSKNGIDTQLKGFDGNGEIREAIGHFNGNMNTGQPF